MSLLPRLAIDIYQDQAIRLGRTGVRNIPQLERLVKDSVSSAFDPLPDPAAPLVAARLLHNLATSRRHVPLNAGSAWAVVETYLLMHDRSIETSDDDVASLLEALEQGWMDAASTMNSLAGWLDRISPNPGVP